MGKLDFFDVTKIYEHATKDYPEECCGFVLKDGSIHYGENIQNFLAKIDPQTYKRNAKTGYTLAVKDTIFLNRSFKTRNPVTIIYHSHPDVGAYFSTEDKNKALFMGRPIYPVKYLVIDVKNKKICDSKIYAWDDIDNTFIENDFL